jgi:hypothetical protein
VPGGLADSRALGMELQHRPHPDRRWPTRPATRTGRGPGGCCGPSPRSWPTRAVYGPAGVEPAAVPGGPGRPPDHRALVASP